MTYLWKKDATEIDDKILAFTAGDDVVWDREIFVYDILATSAHVRGLQRIGILSIDEARTLQKGLEDLETMFLKGEFILDERYEDGHSAIEDFLTSRLGEVGQKVHTGRSRNDQVLVATRLYLRDAMTKLQAVSLEIAECALKRASHSMLVPMPGYTHLQRAVPSSVGLWFAAFAESFLDNATLVQSTADWLNTNPLGTAAGYGVNLALDRDAVTEELGFDRIQLNPIYVQNSRGRFELQALNTLEQIMLDVRRLSWDLSVFTTQEFSFVHIPNVFTTGSSIMPNKRNPDVIELLRASYAVIAGAQTEIRSLLSLPSGYHRDLQYTKGPMIRAFRHGLACLSLVAELLAELTFDRERLQAAITPELYATDLAIEQARKGVPFRDAYRRVAERIAAITDHDPVQSLKNRSSPGAPGNPRLHVLQERLETLKKSKKETPS
jgi:argininosuccinate lyase